MQTFRAILLGALTVFVLIFLWLNWGEPQRVKIWPSEDPIGFDWPVGWIAFTFWLLGLVPMYLYHRGVKWSLSRRIRSLENAARSNALQKRDDPAVAPTDKAVDSLGDKAVDNAAKPGDSLTPAIGAEGK